MKNNTKPYAVCAGLLLCTAVGAYAVPVTFQVDMGYQASLNQFNTDGTDHIEVQSGFNLTGGSWGGNQLTNIPSTTLYQNTFDITSPAPGSVVYYKFHIWGTRDVWENLSWYPGNRLFTLASSAQTVPSAYFGDAWAASGPGGAVTFQIDMSAQVGAGLFNPAAGDLIQAMGAFNNNWNAVALSNDSGAGNTNLYSGTYVETSRPPGTRIEYKFAINVGGSGTLRYESIVGYVDNNRAFVLTNTPPQVLPSVFFSDTSGFPIKAGVYFQLDLSSQILTKAFDPVHDLASIRGDAMGWGDPPGSGLLLYEDAARPGMYTNTWLSASQLTGAPFLYMNTFFHTNGAGYIVWELGPNKSVTFAGNEPTNANGYHMITVGPDLFDNFLADTNDYLPADTLVTFTVSMTNAQSYPGFSPQIVFNQTMGVVINGDWIPWYSWTAAAPAQYYFTNGTSGDLLYSQTVLIPQGNSLQLTYQFGIDDGTDNLDNENGGGTNHVRFIRHVGNYTMPLDTFGTPVTEPLMANLTVGPPVAGHVLVSWLGNPGVHLQTAASIVGATWQDHLDTASYSSPSGIYSTNYPMSAGPTFFRLVKP